MPVAPANGIEIFYDTHGDRSAAPLVLVGGISVQMIWWWDRFVARLADRGLFVVRFDNRDAGLSTRFDEIDPTQAIMTVLGGGGAPYLLSDLAADTVGLLEHLDIESAHFVGQSMGGMIVQTIAIEHPERVRSITSVGSTTGDPDVGQPAPDTLAELAGGAPAVEREAAADGYLRVWTHLAGPNYPCDPVATRAVGLAGFDRKPGGLAVLRQMAAISASGDRTEQLAQLDVPALVIHGDSDVLVDVSGGYATAKAVPGAQLHVVEGLGHDIPEPLWDEFIDLIVANTERHTT